MSDATWPFWLWFVAHCLWTGLNVWLYVRARRAQSEVRRLNDEWLVEAHRLLRKADDE